MGERTMLGELQAARSRLQRGQSTSRQAAE